MNEGDARAQAQRKVIRRVGIAIGILAAVCGVVVVGGVIIFVVGMSQYGSNK